jgi:hypothetical protein
MHQPQYLLGQSPGTQCTGGLVSPRAGLDKYGEEKNLLPSPAFEHRTIQHMASRYTYYAIQPIFQQHNLKISTSRCVLHR